MDTGRLGKSLGVQTTEKGKHSWTKTDYKDIMKKMELLE